MQTRQRKRQCVSSVLDIKPLYKLEGHTQHNNNLRFTDYSLQTVRQQSVVEHWNGEKSKKSALDANDSTAVRRTISG